MYSHSPFAGSFLSGCLLDGVFQGAIWGDNASAELDLTLPPGGRKPDARRPESSLSWAATAHSLLAKIEFIPSQIIVHFRTIEDLTPIMIVSLAPSRRTKQAGEEMPDKSCS